MFAKVDNRTPIEATALSGDIQTVKNLVAMSSTKPIISAETLATLLCSKSGSTQSSKHEIAIYLMKQCEWSALDLQQALVKDDSKLSNLLDWVNSVSTIDNGGLIKKLLKVPAFLDQIRCYLVERDLIQSIINNDLDGFVQKFSFYFAPNSKWKNFIDWFSESYSDVWFEMLSEHGFLKHRELLKGSMQESKFIHLNYLLPHVRKDNVLILRKFIEFGVSYEEFEHHVGQSIKEWCKEKNCLDLLELDEVKKSAEIASLRKGLREYYPKHPSLVKNFESRIIKFIDRYYRDDVIIGDIWLTSGLGKAPYLWKIAVECNMQGLLIYPEILPEKGYTQEMHEAILLAATKGYKEIVHILLKHAKKHMPDAVRFHNDELKDVKSQVLMNQLLQASLPEENPGTIVKIIDYGLSFFAADTKNDDREAHDTLHGKMIDHPLVLGDFNKV